MSSEPGSSSKDRYIPKAPKEPKVKGSSSFDAGKGKVSESVATGESSDSSTGAQLFTIEINEHDILKRHRTYLRKEGKSLCELENLK